ncbi:lysophospholipid acyltransferase family protein [Altericroceibacterium endophyticum]|uniref:1-acyl-sn-glycerol-3-phosphate acyltransferase n=1 Tax=Altericroceibacterium endophyticum TaxID=1808508 RepID=A0A6I4T4B9_9SPHN|nr:lysophospholipid acyltransferase family protein [Altericroceibacterium endophyticum]MXO65199.1 1-acyl-sn-glycerol-3-phosphate acyltransferase [Altericroceibacterium endophyticum]
MNILRSLLFYSLFYGGTVCLLLFALLVVAVAPSRIRGVADGWARYHRFCVTKFLAITVRKEGTEPDYPVLYAFKHESFFEAIDLPVALNCPVIFAKEELFRIPGWGAAALAYGVVPVARDGGAKTLRKMIRSAREFVGQGRPLAIFPEGTRVPHGEVAPLRSGFAGIYKMMRIPVVPVAVDSGPLYHRFWKRKGTITLHFGDVIPADLPRAEIESRVLTAINALNA